MASSAAEPQSVAVQAAYRLNVGNVEQYRLAAREGQGPVPAPIVSKEIASPAKVAALPFAAQIESAAREAELDPALVHALIHVESRHNPAARSPKGALGLMQVLPATASRYGIDNATRSVEANLRAGTRYLRDLMGMFGGRIELVLAAYNAGENAVLRHGERIPPYRETQHYVPAVLEKYREWQAPPPVEPQVEPQVPRRIVYLPGTHLDPSVQSQGGLSSYSQRRGHPG